MRGFFFFSEILVPAGCASPGVCLAFPFCLPYDGSGHRSFFLDLKKKFDLKINDGPYILCKLLHLIVYY